MNLFAIVLQNNVTEIKRVPLSQDVQGQIETFYSDSLNDFLFDKELIEFDGNFKPDEDQLFYINNYPLNGALINSTLNPLTCNILDINDFEGKIIGLFAKLNLLNVDYYVFQHFDSRKIISNRGISLFYNQNTYSRVDTRGISINGKLTAIYTQNQLYFQSYFNTKKIFDLNNYYEEATAEDIDNFIGSEILDFSPIENFEEYLNSTSRKKIKSIQMSGILNNHTVPDIIQKAGNFSINLSANEEGKLIMPSDKSELRNLLRFLDEDYFETSITGTKCMTNSKITLD